MSSGRAEMPSLELGRSYRSPDGKTRRRILKFMWMNILAEIEETNADGDGARTRTVNTDEFRGWSPVETAEEYAKRYGFVWREA